MENNEFVISQSFDFNKPLSGRVYNMESVKKAFEEYKERNHNNPPGMCGFGELGHPSDRFEISFLNVSHTIKSCEYNDGVVGMDVQIINTSSGKNLMGYLMDNPDSFIIAPRMTGEEEHDVDEDGNMLETTHWNVDNIIAWDMIQNTKN